VVGYTVLNCSLELCPSSKYYKIMVRKFYSTSVNRKKERQNNVSFGTPERPSRFENS
jgi:hypothetical protein